MVHYMVHNSNKFNLFSSYEAVATLYICVSTTGDERSSGNPANGSLACTDHDGQFPLI